MNEDKELEARAAFADGDYAQAEKNFRELAAAEPDNALAFYNWGVALSKMDRIEEALACYRRTIELNPAFTDAYINFGAGLNELGLTTQARQGFALARKVDPGHAVATLNEGIAALALGDYESGWRDFTARWELPAYTKFKRSFGQPYWKGEDLRGKNLFLFAEQGFGDTIQMARYADLLAKGGATVMIECPPALTGLMRSLKSGPFIIAQGDEIPNFDFYCAMMDVPRAFGTRLENIPRNIPYLFADPDETERYLQMPHDNEKRVGLCWAGRQSHENDRNRSLAFEQLAPILARDDIDFVSLQRVVSDRDTPLLRDSPVADWGKDFADFAEAAAAIMALDLVITVDTSIAHLAGALGKEVWVLLPFYADWRWLTERADSPWYPSARLFRQKKRRDWDGMISQIVALL